MGWSEAYNFNIDNDISISKAMSLRNGKDPRAGDLHCHETCYRNKQGSRLLTRKESIDKKTGQVKKKAHFARWPNTYVKTGSNCGFAAIAELKRESMDYALYYHKFDQYLSSLSLESDPFFIAKIVKNDGLYEPDFEIIHSREILQLFAKTSIHIIDENKRKMKKFPTSKISDNELIISIRISEYTPEQLIDFQRGGIDKLKYEWDFLMNMHNDNLNVATTANDENSDLRNLINQKCDILDAKVGEFSQKFVHLRSELNPSQDDDYTTLSVKLDKLRSYLDENHSLEEYRGTRRRKSKKFSVHLDSVDSKSYRRLENNPLWKRNYRFRFMQIGGGRLDISREVDPKLAVSLYVNIANMRKKAFRLEYPNEFESKQKQILELERSIQVTEEKLNSQSRKMGLGGPFDNPNDPKVIEIFNLLGGDEFHKQIAELRSKINQIKSELYES